MVLEAEISDLDIPTLDIYIPKYLSHLQNTLQGLQSDH